MLKFRQFRPVVRKYKKGDETENLKVAAKMAMLDKSPKPFYVLMINDTVHECGRTAKDCRNAPAMVAKKQLTFNQWCAVTEAAYIKEQK